MSPADMMGDNLSTKGRLLGATTHPTRRSRAGRVCETDGCVTRLSVYNRSDRCWAHKPDDSRGRRGQRSAA